MMVPPDGYEPTHRDTRGSRMSPDAAAVPAEVADAPSEARFGKFVCTAKLGQGGMGEVWKAWDGDLHRWVALKFLKGSDENEIARFKREAQLAGNLNHPNIAPVYEVGTAHDRHFIAMQYVEGRTLRVFPRRDRRALVRLVRDAAKAVHGAHERGVIHRDLKPDNLMVRDGSDGSHVYVLDFGLARSVQGERSVSGAVVGTPSHMPPEQARGEKVDARADVYSLGSTLYELLMDRAPFAGPTILETLRRVLEEEPKSPRLIDASIDRDLETIVLKCLEKEPERRYGSASQLAAELTRWLDGEPILAHPPSIWYRARKRLFKRRAVAGALLAGLAAVAATVALLLPAWIRAERQRSAMQELNRLWSDVVTAKEWTRQPFRKPSEIRAEFERCVDQLSGFVASHPGLPQGWYVRARARVNLDEIDTAEEDLRRATQIEPHFAPGWTLLAHVRLQRYHRSLRGTDERGFAERVERARPALEDALATLRRAGDSGHGAERWGLSRTREDDVIERLAAAHRERELNKNPRAAESILRHANEAGRAEEYCIWLGLTAGEDALKWFDQAVEIAPHHAGARFDRGCERMRTRNPDGAVDDFTRVLEISPRYPTAFYNRGCARMDAGDTHAAIGDFDAELRIDPNGVAALANRGAAWLDLGDADRALADAEAAIARDPRHAGAAELRIRVRLARGELVEAIADCTQLLARDDGRASAYLLRGRARSLTGDREGAVADLTAAIERDRGLIMAYVNRALARAAAGDSEGAFEDCNLALAVDARSVDALVGRARIRLGRRDAEGAVQDAARALAIRPRHAESRLVHGRARHLRGDLRGAIDDYNEALETDPSCAEAYVYRGIARMKTDPEQAASDLREAERLLPAWSPFRPAVEDALLRLRAPK